LTNYCLSVDEFASELTNGRSGTSIFWGTFVPAKKSKLIITHKTIDNRLNHGRRRLPPMDAFRSICSHDITPSNDVFLHDLSGYTTWNFLLRLVLGG
jgi:hypothetical protein